METAETVFNVPVIRQWFIGFKGQGRFKPSTVRNQLRLEERSIHGPRAMSGASVKWSPGPLWSFVVLADADLAVLLRLVGLGSPKHSNH